MPEPKRSMRRYQVPVDGNPHPVTSTQSPDAVAAIRRHAIQIVEFWAEHRPGEQQVTRTYQVFGTGDQIPDSAIWVGTAPRTPEGFVWHLYQISEETT